MKRSRPKHLAILIAAVAAGAAVYFSSTDDPESLGFAYRGEFHATDVQFLVDETWVDASGRRHVRQEIFDAVFDIIDEAESFILLDFFLVNDFLYVPGPGMRSLSWELAERIIKKRKADPHIPIIFISDPLNTVYESVSSEQFAAMEASGVQIVWTDMNPLPDSNPLISKPWRLFVKPFGLGPGSAVKNPVGEGSISMRSLLKLLNFKANHRKIMVTDKSLLVTSANPHDGSSAHWNTALRINGAGMKQVVESEASVLKMSGAGETAALLQSKANGDELSEGYPLEVLTEIRIKEKVLDMINRVDRGDRLELTMFYLSGRDILRALIHAHQRGGEVRVILDPNKDAFGRTKNGIPNRQSAFLLQREGVAVRWADTHGEQCHVKMLLTDYRDGHSELLLGSCNFTRRNMNNLNLECNIALQAPSDDPVITDARAAFNRWWTNEHNRIFTTAYDTYKDEEIFRRVQAWWMEQTGMCTF